MTGKKRLDLQGIRGLAILAVLGFHFYPYYFPNGYLGVDQFFVLSGFLMCMLLKRSENEAACTLISLFYSKRFKRILPLYLILIFISMIALYSFFPDTAIETNQESAIYALVFVSNRPKTDQENYFQMLSTAIDIFTHTWSLSVEIQFYFLVPFLFLLGSKLPKQYLQYSFYLIISLIFFYVSSDTVAFNNVFARIWQFLIGMMIYLASSPISKSDTSSAQKSGSSLELEYRELKNQGSDEELGGDPGENGDEEDGEAEIQNFKNYSTFQGSKTISYVSLIILSVVLTYPLALPAAIVRPLITVGTGFLMLISEGNAILSNRLLTYIGDISYSLYLIHWPIYAYWKLTCDGDQKLLVLSLVSSVLLAILVFETYEKWYLKLSSTSIGLLCVLLFFMNVVLINKDEISYRIETYGQNIGSRDDATVNMTINDAKRMNYHWSKNDYINLFTPSCVYEVPNTPFGWCRHTGLSTKGKYKFATIGNSWTANHATMFYQECSSKARSIMQGSAYVCEPLYAGIGKEVCSFNMTEIRKRIEEEKPDFAFIFTRYIDIGKPFPRNVTSFDKDPVYQTMKTQMLEFIANIKYKLYILDALPRIKISYIGIIAKLLKTRTDPVNIDKAFVDFYEYDMARRRHAQLIKDCKGKCVLVDYVPEFYNNATGTFRYFDERGFSYWTTSSHLSPHGIEHVRHVWRDICRKL